jgi:hypothetical protein
VLQVSVIDTTSNPMRVIQSITIDPDTIASPGGIALSTDGTKLYVTSDAIDKLHIVTLATGAVATVQVGDSPMGVATDADGRVCVGNASAGTVTVFAPTYDPTTGLPAPKTVRVGSTPFVFGAFTTAGPPAPPPPAQFILSLSTVGSGTITANPQTVSGTYTAGTVVNLSATPAASFQFAGWSGACTGTGACSVTMDAAKSVTATFTLKQFALVLATVGNGTITASPLPVGGTYGAGTVVSLTATPAANSQFTGWSGACSGSSSCSVTMDATKSVTATFTLKQFVLTLNTVGSGTITASPAPVNGTYAAGTVVSLTATPAAGSQFSGWSGACTGTGSCSVMMNAAASVTATFAALPPPPPQQYTLTLSTVGTGSIGALPGSVGGKYTPGAVVGLTANPGAGFKFNAWSGACSGNNPNCTVTMNASKNATATFIVAPMTCDDKIKDLQGKVTAFKHPWWHDHQLKVALKMFADSLAELNRAKAKVGNNNDKRIVHAQKEFDNGKNGLCLGHYWRADHEFWETYVIAHEILKTNRR